MFTFPGGGGGSVCVAQNVPDQMLAQFAGGEIPREKIRTDSISLFATDVTGHLNPEGSSEAGPSGTTATVMVDSGFFMFVR